jgi:enoyl-CoA hydratase
MTPSFSLDESAAGLVLCLRRPPVNAVDLQAVLELEQAFGRCAGARSLILTGQGDAFCAGVDTRAFAAYGQAERAALVLAITRMTAALLALPCPVVAAVNGHALGGGFVLMLCADYRLASDAPGLKFGLTEARAGIPFPAGPARIIRTELPPGLLRNLTLSSRVTGAAELHQALVLDGLCAPAALPEAAARAASTLAAQPAFAAVKQQVRGELAREVALLARSNDDAFLGAFGGH